MAAQQEGKKVFISADMEGVSSIVAWDEVDRGEEKYHDFCKLMTEDVNAAVEGAIAAGAEKVVVRDAHATARNILPAKLHKEAELIRDWSGRPLSMMDGISADFDVALFVGYHAGPGIEGGTLGHSMSGKFQQIKLNGKPACEAYLNGLTAGYFGVPVGFISGDEACCRQASRLIPAIEVAIVKYGLGEAVRALPLEKARHRIKKGASDAVASSEELSVLGKDMTEFNLEIDYRKLKDAISAGNYPGATQSDYRVQFSSSDYFDILTFLHFAT